MVRGTPGDIKSLPSIGTMSIKDAERVTMQATPLNNPAGIPNDRDTADSRVIPGPDHDTGSPSTPGTRGC